MKLIRLGANAVHGFEGSSLRTFRRARELGMTCILDVASDHHGYIRVLNLESAKLAKGAPTGARSPFPQLKERPRIDEERRLAQYLLVPSEHIRRTLIREHLNEHLIHVIPYGVDVQRLTPSPSRNGANSQFMCLFVGAMSYGKGLQYLLDAWAQLDLDSARLFIVGGGDTTFQQVLESRGPSSVKWIGPVARNQVVDFYQSADIFVFPSLSESFGFVVAEAMACGLPVVTTPTAGSVVRDGIDGFIVPPYDVEALKDRILRLYHNRDERLRMGRNAREHIVSNYTWQHYEERLARFYRETVFGGKSSSLTSD